MTISDSPVECQGERSSTAGEYNRRSVDLLFCNDPVDPSSVDAAFADELDAARAVGLPYELLSFEALVELRDARTATRRVARSRLSRPAVYRGWPLAVERYGELYEALEARGVRLVTSPLEYRRCQYLPEVYPAIAARTPKTVWHPCGTDVDVGEVLAVVSAFGDAPVVVKDYVKSARRHWDDACFIPSAGDAESVLRVVRRFLELTGPQLEGGLVFREHVALEQIGDGAAGSPTRPLEYRIFFLWGKPLLTAPRWTDVVYPAVHVPLVDFLSVANEVRSPFFALDVARTPAGDWVILDLGDGQVAEVPGVEARRRFFERLVLTTTGKGGDRWKTQGVALG